MFNGTLTDLPGLLVGQTQNETARTGCTAVLCPEGMACAVDVRGAAPGTRETDLLQPGCLVERIHGIMLCGGSAYGLDACSGAMRFLEERGVGLDVTVARVPIVCGAVIFDLGVGDPAVRPDAVMGYAACVAASGAPVVQGPVGAGCGATVGKLLGQDHACPGGIGSATVAVGEALVSALVCVNALGDVTDPAGNILAGARDPATGAFANGWQRMLQQPHAPGFGNTTIGVVATDAPLDKAQLRRLAGAAHNGLALTIRPVHTQNDGDTLFAASTGKGVATDLTALCVAATEAMARAVQNAVMASNGR